MVGTRTTWQESVKIILTEQLQYTIYFLYRNNKICSLSVESSTQLNLICSIILGYLLSIECFYISKILSLSKKMCVYDVHMGALYTKTNIYLFCI